MDMASGALILVGLRFFLKTSLIRAPFCCQAERITSVSSALRLSSVTAD